MSSLKGKASLVEHFKPYCSRVNSSKKQTPVLNIQSQAPNISHRPQLNGYLLKMVTEILA